MKTLKVKSFWMIYGLKLWHSTKVKKFINYWPKWDWNEKQNPWKQMYSIINKINMTFNVQPLISAPLYDTRNIFGLLSFLNMLMGFKILRNNFVIKLIVILWCSLSNNRIVTFKFLLMRGNGWCFIQRYFECLYLKSDINHFLSHFSLWTFHAIHLHTWRKWCFVVSLLKCFPANSIFSIKFLINFCLSLKKCKVIKLNLIFCEKAYNEVLDFLVSPR